MCDSLRHASNSVWAAPVKNTSLNTVNEMCECGRGRRLQRRRHAAAATIDPDPPAPLTRRPRLPIPSRLLAYVGTGVPRKSLRECDYVCPIPCYESVRGRLSSAREISQKKSFPLMRPSSTTENTCYINFAQSLEPCSRMWKIQMLLILSKIRKSSQIKLHM